MTDPIEFYKKCLEDEDMIIKENLVKLSDYDYLWNTCTTDLNSPINLALMALLTYHGKGCQVDINEAVRLNELAIQKRSIIARYNLAQIYQSHGELGDFRYQYRMASIRGHGASMLALAYYYVNFSNHACIDLYSTAGRYFDLAAEKGNIAALKIMAREYAHGGMVKKDEVKSAQLYERLELAEFDRLSLDEQLKHSQDDKLMVKCIRDRHRLHEIIKQLQKTNVSYMDQCLELQDKIDSLEKS